uniref:Uncharacterized protein n=1 Tax=Glossina palpalis gambiensis TaxID=67801 RepID=A0A1B0AVE3_9MUSC
HPIGFREFGFTVSFSLPISAFAASHRSPAIRITPIFPSSAAQMLYMKLNANLRNDSVRPSRVLVMLM